MAWDTNLEVAKKCHKCHKWIFSAIIIAEAVKNMGNDR
jgi:hypothetical protein